MEVYVCQPAIQALAATVSLPGSKSITNRALIAAGLAEGHSVLSNVLIADDTELMMEALRSLGIAVTVDVRTCMAEVSGCGGQIPACEAKLFVGNSGTTMRFCTALVCLAGGRYELDGVARMRKRPIGPLVDALRRLGSAIEYVGEDGFPPIVVHARGLKGGEVRFAYPKSSQWVSALLLVAPYAFGDVLVEVTGELPSLPYVQMTTRLMEDFGVAVLESIGRRATGRGETVYEEFLAKFVVEGTRCYRGRSYEIEPDASNAGYFLAAPAIAGGRVVVKGLGTESIQGDVRFVDVLERMGCRVTCEPRALKVEGPPPALGLKGIEVDLNEMPDQVPTVAVLALFSQGPTTIRNVANLRIKESDRIAALAKELCKLGARVDELDDGLRISPPDKLLSGTIDTYQDHRMAMSFALAGLRCPGLSINDPRCVAKTFPDFFTRFEKLAGP